MTDLADKTCFQNRSNGWLSAVQIVEGRTIGVPVEPDGHVWLDEKEQRLTAMAPKKPEDNPFVEQTRIVTDPESNEFVEMKMVPLVAVTADERYIPGGRPIPGDIAQLESEVVQEKVEAPVYAPAAVSTPTPPPAPVVPARARKAANALSDHQITNGMGDPADPVGDSYGAQEAVMAEEFAAKVDPKIGEETGAAQPPSGDAPEGQYTAMEEVGTPQAPATPAPYVPED